MKRYSIYVLDKVADPFVFRHGPTGPVKRPNLGTPPVYPSTFIRCLYADESDLYGDDPTKRTQLWEDSSGTVTDAEIFAACPRIRDWQAAQIRQVGAFRLDQLAQPYQPAERDTWPTQLAEADAYLADQTAPTPMLNAIADGRGIPLDELIILVMGNADLFRIASGSILGQQQALLAIIYTTQSVEELLAVRWPE